MSDDTKTGITEGEWKAVYSGRGPRGPWHVVTREGDRIATGLSEANAKAIAVMPGTIAALKSILSLNSSSAETELREIYAIALRALAEAGVEL